LTFFTCHFCITRASNGEAPRLQKAEAKGNLELCDQMRKWKMENDKWKMKRAEI